ncbi:hypothetical protein [Kitasatospora kifunensis]|uniref:Uncharacterized protein n=1 Tax=Kitasatospora kifunensis TaxID=58351 RepID=A0A7W7QY17_KITKI|nr:hypothetical protein [Kitasatospora kifunensis]MBB4921888.1 hypothetical protein [Kitasatospora kifunensis]
MNEFELQPVIDTHTTGAVDPEMPAIADEFGAAAVMAPSTGHPTDQPAGSAGVDDHVPEDGEARHLSYADALREYPRERGTSQLTVYARGTDAEVLGAATETVGGGADFRSDPNTRKAETAEQADSTGTSAPGSEEVADPVPPRAQDVQVTGRAEGAEIVGLADPGVSSRSERYAPYLPIAAMTVPGRIERIDTVANMIVGPTGSIVIEQNTQVRTADLLETYLVPRDDILRDASYVEVRQWREVAEKADTVLRDSAVMFVVAPRQVGSTTFCLRYLAEKTPKDVSLLVAEASWEHPLASRLPAQPDSAFLLDLRDPVRDRIDTAFLTGLRKHADSLRSMGSYLVLTITPELWSGLAGHDLQGLPSVRLGSHPEPGLVIRQHLMARGRAALLPHLDGSEVTHGIEDWSPVRAVRLVSELIEVADSCARSAGEGGSVADDSLQQIAQAVRRLVSGWQEILDRRFADRGSDSGLATPVDQSGPVVPLSADDRYLSIAQALRGSAPATQIEQDAERLADELAGSEVGNARKDGRPDLRPILAGMGLRTRLRGLGATVDLDGTASFPARGYGDALLLHVWGQYEKLHSRFISWMITCAGQGDDLTADPAVRAIIRVLSYYQDDSKLKELRTSAGQRRSDVVAAVMVAAARDEHLGRRARELLYTWASSTEPHFHALVVSVCRELIKDQAGPALTRLRRVADRTTDSKVIGAVFETFTAIAMNPAQTLWFATLAAEWRRQPGTVTSAANLATLALMQVERDGVPWLLGEDVAEAELVHALRALLAELEKYQQAPEAIGLWVRRCPPGEPRQRAVRIIRDAFAEQAGLKALTRVMLELGRVRDPHGGSPGEELRRALVEDDPEMNTILSWGVRTA